MKAMKNPVVAVLLAIIMVAAATLLSAGTKLEKKSQAVTDGFYNGVRYDGYKHSSAYSQLTNLCGAADGMTAIASNYGIDCNEVSQASKALKDSLSTMHNHIAAIYKCYSALDAALTALDSDIDSAPLSTRDAEGVAAYRETLSNAKRVIAESGYNESVRNYTNSLGFPAAFFASICGVDAPEYFA